jgi:hypothetical protein
VVLRLRGEVASPPLAYLTQPHRHRIATSNASDVGLDVGGTTMKAGVVSLPTEASRGQELGLERLAETMRRPGRAGSHGHVALRGLID